MPIITPVFNFNGNGEEAIELYKKAFDAKILCLLRYSDADKRDYDVALSDKQKNMIYHAEIRIGEQRIMLSDILDLNLTASASMFLNVTFDTPEEVMRAYEVFKDDSTIIYPVQSTTYSSCMVTLIDKFGIRWSMMTETV